MPKFSPRSQKILSTCHVDLRKVLADAIKSTNFSVLSGKRGMAEQNELHRTGKSQLRWPNSMHCSEDDPEGLEDDSAAVDIGLYKASKGRVDWKDTEAWLVMQGHIERVAWDHQIGLRFGSNWDNDEDFDDENFRDYGHIELAVR